MQGDLRRVDTTALAAAAVALDDLAQEVGATRVAVVAAAARTGVDVAQATALLSGVGSALTDRALDLRARVGLAEHWDATAAAAGWRAVDRIRDSLRHLEDDANRLLTRLPEADRHADPLDALVAGARSGLADATTLLASLHPHLAGLLRRADGLEVLADLVRAALPDAPDVGLLTLLVELVDNEVAAGTVAASTSTLVRETVVALVRDALEAGHDVGEVADLLGRVDDELVPAVVPLLTPEAAARLTLALVQRDGLDPGVTGVLPLLSAALSDAAAVAGLTSRELATLLSLVARADGTPMMDAATLSTVLVDLGPRLRPGGDLVAIRDEDGLALLTDGDVRRLVELGDESVSAAAVDSGLVELEALLTNEDGTIPREVDALLGHRLRSIGEWLGTVADVVSDTSSNAVEAFQDVLSLVVTSAVPGVGGGVLAGMASSWIDSLAGRDPDEASDVAIASSLEDSLRSMANHAVPALAISAVMDGFRAAAMDT